jgi:hypothetical protein
VTGRPTETEFAPYYLRYVSLVSEAEVLPALDGQLADVARAVASVTPAQETYRYAAGKWSVREVLGHMIDAERVFGYRAFCISRGETAPLPSFNENDYVAESRYHDEPLADLGAEFAATRRSNLAFLSALTDAAWRRIGTASNKPVSVRALAFIMVGHVRHHLNAFQSSYGITAPDTRG